MRLKFWKREKKTLSLREAKEMTEEWDRQTPYTINLGDLSMADNITAEDIEKLNRERHKDQCHGKLKSGARCSRVINDATYCWQHKWSGSYRH